MRPRGVFPGCCSSALLLMACLASGAAAQELRVYSEFQRIDPFGNVVAADRAESPREILSPALARNAWATFQIVVEPAGGGPYSLFLAQNPEQVVEPKLYRPVFVKRGEEWIPERLERVDIAANGEAAGIVPQVPGQKVLVYWMDLWVPPDAPVRRTRFEIQLNRNDRWAIYPMEVRIQAARPMRQAAGAAPAVPAMAAAGGGPSSNPALSVLRSYVCAVGASPREPGMETVEGIIRRNALQDQALARALENSAGRAALVSGMLASFGATDVEAWCRDPKSPPETGAEWYLRVRDYLYKSAREAAVAAPLR